MTTSTPVSEITTLSSQSSTNVSSTHAAASSSSLSTDIDVTTISSPDESLKVLPLNSNKTISSDDKDDSTVTSSTQSPMTVNLYDTEIKPEIIANDHDGAMEQFVNNDSDKQANQRQMESRTMVSDEMNERHLNFDVIQEKEGRAINFPLEISGGSNQNGSSNNNQHGHMQGPINFVTTSTDKPRVMSFFDLSDVNMEKDDGGDNVDVDNIKLSKKKINKDKPPVEQAVECSFNGTNYKASGIIYVLIPLIRMKNPEIPSQ